MYAQMFRSLVGLWISLITCVHYASAQAPAKYALLVAVTRYNHAAMNEPVPLQFPEADAAAVAQVLKDSGYTVDLLLGPKATQAAISEKLDELGSKGNQSGVVVVGFWGHGVEIQGTTEAMFCPFDTTLRVVKYADGSLAKDKQTQKPLNEPDPKKLIGMAEVLAALGSSGAGNRVLLADCCRNSPHIPRGRAFGSSVKLSDLPNNTAALFACSTGEKAFEYQPWGHGAFTKSLLDLFPQMAADQDDVPGIAGRLKRSVAQAVNTASNGSEKQTVNPIINGVPDLLLVSSGKSKPMPSADKSNPVPNRAKPTSEQPDKTYTSRATGMEFVLISRGTFIMGSAESEAEHEKDEQQHQVTISRDFYMGKYEVTQGEYKRVMGINPSHFSGSDRLPVETVSWYDAVWFCNQLSELDGRIAAYRITNVVKDGDSIKSAKVSFVSGADGYRLPTESEWEYACRPGTKTPFSFGANITTAQVNFNGEYPYAGAAKGEYRQKTLPVEFGTPNSLGLFNMHGNVNEWSWDWKADYPTGSVADPIGPENGSLRVFRGGSWVNFARHCRSARRNSNSPEDRSFSVGFRVAVGR